MKQLSNQGLPIYKTPAAFVLWQWILIPLASGVWGLQALGHGLICMHDHLEAERTCLLLNALLA